MITGSTPGQLSFDEQNAMEVFHHHLGHLYDEDSVMYFFLFDRFHNAYFWGNGSTSDLTT